MSLIRDKNKVKVCLYKFTSNWLITSSGASSKVILHFCTQRRCRLCGKMWRTSEVSPPVSWQSSPVHSGSTSLVPRGSCQCRLECQTHLHQYTVTRKLSFHITQPFSNKRIRRIGQKSSHTQAQTQLFSQHIIMYGPRSFAVAGPSTWNSLPAALRSCQLISTFRCDLKTELFIRAYH